MNEIHKRFAGQGLSRPTNGRVLGGVCAGLGRRFGLERWPARLIFLLVLMIIPGSQILIYPVLWVLMPSDGFVPQPTPEPPVARSRICSRHPAVTVDRVTERRRRPTLRDIAEDTGLSSAAVSYALRGLHVPLETQARVRESADRLGYQVDPIARALASGRTGTIGVLCGSLTDPWQQSVAAALGRALLGAGRNALTVDAGNDPAREAELARRLVDQRVDAVIVLPVDPLAGHWAETAASVPVVAVGDGLPGAVTACEVMFDNATGMTDGLRRLAAFGHTRVVVLTPTDRATPERPVVVQQVAAELGLTARLRTAPHDLDGAAAVVLAQLRSPEAPTAFLCLADAIAFGVYAAAAELGIRVPDDVSVLGYDDQPVSRLLSPPLSSYRWPLAELVEHVVRCTVAAVDEGQKGDRFVVTATAMPRQSVAAPRPTPP